MITRITAVFMLLVTLSACKPAKETFNELLNAGRLQGVSRCVELSTTDLISNEAIRRTCVAKFERDIPQKHLFQISGSGGPEKRGEKRVFAGTLANASSDYVVTQLVIEVRFSANATSKAVAAAPRRSIYTVSLTDWIEPGEDDESFTSDEVSGPPRDWGESPSCREGVDERCWSWSILSGKGLRV